jgi:hypothetical protein
MTRILLVDGPFHWRTMILPGEFTNRVLYLPLPLTPRQLSTYMPEATDHSALTPHLEVASYCRVSQLAIGQQVTDGWIYQYEGTR